LGKILGTLVLFLVILGMGVYAYYNLPYDDQMRPVHVVVPEGATLDQTAGLLEDQGVIRFHPVFSRIVWVMGQDRNIRAGEYNLHSSMSPRQVLQMLCRGEVVLHKVTIPEGFTVKQIATLLEKSGVASAQKILAENREVGLIETFGFEGDSLEGYLFPDTYYFARGLPPEEILKAMVQRFHSVYGPRLRARQAEMGRSLHEVVTMASVVEKETSSRKEMPLVASVLVNRLRIGMPLQCDPTVIYGIEDFDGNLTREHLLRPNPYNTYVNKGLPPGPICNPGLDALKAVLYPADTAYLYFVSKNDGTHLFSPTLKEHNRAVEEYQKRRRKSSGGGK
ncbi:MAG: endolytic transglycosylase MltG, partial [Thermodesulfobacteriota bacterium]